MTIYTAYVLCGYLSVQTSAVCVHEIKTDVEGRKLTRAPRCGPPPPGAAAGEDDRTDELSPAQFDAVVPRYDHPVQPVRLHTPAQTSDTHHDRSERQPQQHFHSPGEKKKKGPGRISRAQVMLRALWDLQPLQIPSESSRFSAFCFLLSVFDLNQVLRSSKRRFCQCVLSGFPPLLLSWSNLIYSSPHLSMV